MAVISERPGVYASYEVSSVINGGAGRGVVGLAAGASAGTENEVYDIFGAAGAESVFGADSQMAELAALLFKNGAAHIKAVRTEGETASDYEKAFAALAAEESIRYLVCGSSSPEVHGKMKASINGASDRCACRVGIVEGAGDAAGLISAAGALNSERMVLAGPGAEGERPGCVAAALAGLLAASADPAAPVNGAELKGIGGLSRSFTEAEIDALIKGGVTPAERVNGTASVIRGVTTRTTTGGAADGTWRELTTILIVDDVIPTVRDALRSKFTRAKNTAQTRGAIRTQVILELQDKLRREIIDSYDSVTVTQDTGDPTLCLVDFQFTVAHGLNRIQLTAHISV